MNCYSVIVGGALAREVCDSGCYLWVVCKVDEEETRETQRGTV
jgi:RAB protein geranylgeranyltransferase component A